MEVQERGYGEHAAEDRVWRTLKRRLGRLDGVRTKLRMRFWRKRW